MGKRELDSCSLCVKYSIFAMNFIYFALGSSCLGVSIWIFVDRNFMSAVFGVELMTVATIFLIICGGVIVLISFLGCCGAVLESKCLILSYCISVSLVFLVMIIAGVLASVFQTRLNEEVRNSMKRVLEKDYGVDLDQRYNRVLTDAWDEAQQFLECCSVDESGWGLYKGSSWFLVHQGADTTKPLVPDSCCKKFHDSDNFIDLGKCQTWQQGPPTMQSGANNEALHYRGCYPAGKDFVKEHSAYLIIFAFTVGVSMIIGFLLALYLYIQLARF